MVLVPPEKERLCRTKAAFLYRASCQSVLYLGGITVPLAKSYNSVGMLIEPAFPGILAFRVVLSSLNMLSFQGRPAFCTRSLYLSFLPSTTTFANWRPLSTFTFLASCTTPSCKSYPSLHFRTFP